MYCYDYQLFILTFIESFGHNNYCYSILTQVTSKQNKNITSLTISNDFENNIIFLNI